MPLLPTKSKNQAHLANGSNEQTVTHIEGESKFDGSDPRDELQAKTASRHAIKSDAQWSKR